MKIKELSTKTLIIILGVLNVYDYISTAIIVEAHGSLAEANIIMRWVIDYFSIHMILVLKTVAILYIWCRFVYLDNRNRIPHPTTLNVALLIMVAMYAVVCMLNTWSMGYQ